MGEKDKFNGSHSWEEAVSWLRDQKDQESLVRACYYDDPLVEAARRFAGSHEWQATTRLLPRKKGLAVDIGAGRGISTYALAGDGWDVLAVEPDPSSMVGGQAIRSLAAEAKLSYVRVVQATGEDLPLAAGCADLVYAREVLHHASDLGRLCREASRVLRRNGLFVSCREHVITRHEDLPSFLENHPLHRLYGGEKALLLQEYQGAIREAGFRIVKTLGPFDSDVNTDGQMSYNDWWAACCDPLCRVLGTSAIRLLTSRRHMLGRVLLRRLARRQSQLSDAPGRLYTFVAGKQ
jgi:SAM-dependent methyltransferase